MKKVIVSILQIVGYFIAFLAATIALMGGVKMFVGDWEAGGFMLDLAAEGGLTILGIALTNLLIFLAARSSGVFRGWPALRTSLSGFAGGSIAGLAMALSMLFITLALGGATLVLGMLVLYFRRRGAPDLPPPVGRRNDEIGTSG
ncbi:MAG: hypothetical protein QNL88_11305 [Acidobacteriota bacterium]|nr:hypothetical protein [Acidobacteriota bacterium]